MSIVANRPQIGLGCNSRAEIREIAVHRIGESGRAFDPIPGPDAAGLGFAGRSSGDCDIWFSGIKVVSPCNRAAGLER
jgi:hypothetical protein